MADFPWNNFGGEQAQPAGQDNGYAEPADSDNTEPENVETSEAENTEPEFDEQASAEETVEESSPEEAVREHAESKRREKKNGVVPTVDRWAAKKLVDCYNVLNTEQGAAAAKSILGAGTGDPATLLAQLSEKKNRKRVNEIVEQVKSLTDSDSEAVLMMNLALAFSADKDLAKSLFGLFNAIAPDKGFGRSTGDPRKDAKTIADKWGDDGIDLTVLSALKL